MILKGIEVEFDFLDADSVEKMEKEFEKVKEECIKKEKLELKVSEIIREECRIIDEFIDNVFGKGISEKIFNNKKNLKEHIEVFQEIANEKMKYQNDLTNTFYRYQPNREQRRNNKYRKNNRRKRY